VGNRYRKKALKTPFILNRLGLNLLGEFSIAAQKNCNPLNLSPKSTILCYMLLNLREGKKGNKFYVLTGEVDDD
jgi:hypothetical protein